ncbi:MAG TPA: hypothetical protein VGD67_18240 [Pseudonocardiaceae bacterium]
MSPVNGTRIDLDRPGAEPVREATPTDATPTDATPTDGDAAGHPTPAGAAADGDAAPEPAAGEAATSASDGDDEPPAPEPATAEPEATTTDAEAAAADAEPAPPDGGPARRRRVPVAVVLAVAAVALTGLGVWFTLEARAVRDTPAAANTALVDTGTTAEVSAALTSSLNKLFSYSYDKPEVTERAAAEALRGPALDTYNQLFAQVRELAPQQKIVLTTRVVHIAVQSISGDRAQVLVFLDQSATRADNNTTSTGAAQLSVTAQRQGASWVIIDLTPR